MSKIVLEAAIVSFAEYVAPPASEEAGKALRVFIVTVSPSAKSVISSEL